MFGYEPQSRTVKAERKVGFFVSRGEAEWNEEKWNEAAARREGRNESRVRRFVAKLATKLIDNKNGRSRA